MMGKGDMEGYEWVRPYYRVVNSKMQSVRGYWRIPGEGRGGHRIYAPGPRGQDKPTFDSLVRAYVGTLFAAMMVVA